MSYTTDIKNEISNNEYNRSESIAELSAIVNFSSEIYKNKFTVTTENISTSRRIYKLFKNLYNVDLTLESSKINNLSKNKIINIEIKENVEAILSDLSIVKNNKRNYIPEDFICDNEEEKIAYLRGTFLTSGSINDPKTSRYHLEFIINNKESAYFINELLLSFSLRSKVLKRDKNYMVYIKESEKISDFIKLIGAYNSLFYFEDIRIYRDHKNMTNRLNNCEQANVDKIINSSNEQLKLIKKLKKQKDFDLLDEKIKEICIYKEKYKESSMTELAEIISYETGNNITKSGINHRFRKIKEILKENGE